MVLKATVHAVFKYVVHAVFKAIVYAVSKAIVHVFVDCIKDGDLPNCNSRQSNTVICAKHRHERILK